MWAEVRPEAAGCGARLQWLQKLESVEALQNNIEESKFYTNNEHIFRPKKIFVEEFKSSTIQKT